MPKSKPPRAQNNYRGIKLTLTQSGSGSYLWNLWTKPYGARWDQWKCAMTGEVTHAPQVTSTAGALHLLLNVLDTELAVLSQRAREREAGRPGAP